MLVPFRSLIEAEEIAKSANIPQLESDRASTQIYQNPGPTVITAHDPCVPVIIVHNVLQIPTFSQQNILTAFSNCSKCLSWSV